MGRYLRDIDLQSVTEIKIDHFWEVQERQMHRAETCWQNILFVMKHKGRQTSCLCILEQELDRILESNHLLKERERQRDKGDGGTLLKTIVAILRTLSY